MFEYTEGKKTSKGKRRNPKSQSNKKKLRQKMIRQYLAILNILHHTIFYFYKILNRSNESK